MLIDLNELQKHISDKLINYEAHPDYSELWVLKYSVDCVLNRHWNTLTKMCRGLVIDNTTGQVISKPFDKFFNFDEYPKEDQNSLLTLPESSFVVQEKLDGSLIILSVYKNKILMNTPGRFNSDQVIKAEELLSTTYKYQKDVMIKHYSDYTHLFEIIYPENNIVVNYGNAIKLVYLTSIHTESGIEEFGLLSGMFPEPRQLFINKSLEEIINIVSTSKYNNSEGVVVRITGSDLRIKIKNNDYKLLHRLKTQPNIKDIINAVKNNTPASDLLKNIPDEFFNELLNKEKEITNKFNSIKEKAYNNFNEIINNLSENYTRKEFALKAIQREKYDLIFLILDKKDITEAVWDYVIDFYKNS